MRLSVISAVFKPRCWGRAAGGILYACQRRSRYDTPPLYWADKAVMVAAPFIVGERWRSAEGGAAGEAIMLASADRRNASAHFVAAGQRWRWSNSLVLWESRDAPLMSRAAWQVSIGLPAWREGTPLHILWRRGGGEGRAAYPWSCVPQVTQRTMSGFDACSALLHTVRPVCCLWLHTAWSQYQAQVIGNQHNLDISVSFHCFSSKRNGVMLTIWHCFK